MQLLGKPMTFPIYNSNEKHIPITRLESEVIVILQKSHLHIVVAIYIFVYFRSIRSFIKLVYPKQVIICQNFALNSMILANQIKPKLAA